MVPPVLLVCWDKDVMPPKQLAAGTENNRTGADIWRETIPVGGSMKPDLLHASCVCPQTHPRTKLVNGLRWVPHGTFLGCEFEQYTTKTKHGICIPGNDALPQKLMVAVVQVLRFVYQDQIVWNVGSSPCVLDVQQADGGVLAP